MAKPDTEFFRAILREIGFLPGDALFLDDHEENVVSARRAGLAASVYSLASGADVLRGLLRQSGVGVA